MSSPRDAYTDMIPFTLSGGTLERHEAARAKPGFLQRVLAASPPPRLVVVHNGGAKLVVAGEGDRGDALEWHHPLEGNGAATERLIYLGEDAAAGGLHLFAVHVRHVSASFLAARRAVPTKGPLWLGLAPDAQAAIGLALSLVQWHAANAFCGRCGGAATYAGDVGFSARCTKCKRQAFPTIAPAVLVAVLDGRGNVILSQRRRRSNQMTILSGFVVHGEAAEETVAREVLEETGATVTSMRFIGSQPWPYPNLLMLSFYAVAPQSPQLTAQEEELARVAWVSKADVRRAMAGEHPDMTTPMPWTAAYQILRPWVDGEVDDFGRVVPQAKL